MLKQRICVRCVVVNTKSHSRKRGVSVQVQDNKLGRFALDELNSNHYIDFKMNAAPRSKDILKIFPYEVWPKCIMAAIDREPEGPLPFLNISTHWQTLLLDTPELWTYIHIEDGEDLAARVHLFLHLSRHCPLEVAVDFSEPSWTAVRGAICDNTRWQYSDSQCCGPT